MKSLRIPLLAGVLATGLVLTGCGGNSWPSASGPVPTESPTSSTAATPSAASGDGGSSGSGSSEGGGSSDGGGGTNGGGNGGGDNGGGDNGGGGGQPAAERCTAGDLTAAPGRTTGEAGQRHTIIVWTNTSEKPCTMSGFGGVDLRGPEDPAHGPSYSLPRSSEQGSPVRLAPNGTAHTVITWLPGKDWTPTKVVATPPDETTPKTLQWPGGAVLRQDGATHPGTYIGPVTAGSE